jgi:hypothetical protein
MKELPGQRFPSKPEMRLLTPQPLHTMTTLARRKARIMKSSGPGDSTSLGSGYFFRIKYSRSSMAVPGPNTGDSTGSFLWSLFRSMRTKISSGHSHRQIRNLLFIKGRSSHREQVESFPRKLMSRSSGSKISASRNYMYLNLLKVLFAMPGCLRFQILRVSI